MKAQFFRGVLILTCTWFQVSLANGGDQRVGIIGTDTSHATAFTEILNDTTAKDHVAGGNVVAAYQGGSPDIPESWNRVNQYATTLRTKYGVQFYDSLDELCRHVDAVLLESVDGRPHLAQVKPVLAAHKAVFIDKPMADSLAGVMRIFRLARTAKVPVFSSSALRFAADTQAVSHGSIGEVSYAETYGPCELEPHHPELFWYGVHGIEALYTVMGTGCQTVQQQRTPNGKIEVVGLWPGGRKGVFREDKKFHGLARGSKGEAPVGSFDGYAPLVQQIIKFFQTGIAPVKPEETIEIFAFMEAAEASKNQGGKPVNVQSVLAEARNAAK
jgi:hypothetical protein